MTARNTAERAQPPSERTIQVVQPVRPPESGSVAVGAPRVEAGLFRARAVESYLSTLRKSEVLRVAPPWSRGILGIATLFVIAAIAATFIVRVEQTGRGRGVLRVAGGSQSIVAQTSGVVLDVAARSGTVVPEGTLLASIDSTATKTSLLEADREITRAERDVATFVARRDKEQASRIGLLHQRASLLGQRAQAQRANVARLTQRLASYDRLIDAGVASSMDRGTIETELAQSQQEALQLEGEISGTRLSISNISAELTQELDRLKAVVQKAKDRREALEFQLRQTEVRAPHAGRVDALVAKVGDSVSVGTPIARLIPEGAPREVVVFIPEADRAFLHEGSEVRVELDQLPVGEFGSLRARIVRIGADLATPSEIGEALLDTRLEAATYRVELQLEDDEVARKLEKLLRPGSLVTARFVLRKRRLVTVLFTPFERLFR